MSAIKTDVNTKMFCIPITILQSVSLDRRTTIFVVIIFLLLMSLMGLSAYMIFRPIECINQQRYLYVAKMIKMKAFDKQLSCKEVPITFFPQAIAIIETNTNFHVCSGVIISTQWILTAARCLLSCADHRCSNYSVRVQSSYSNRNGNLYLIRNVIIHPLFNSSTVEHDLALIKTDYTNVNGIPLLNDTPVTVDMYGWSPFSKADNLYRDNVLKTVHFDVIPKSLCNIYLQGERTKFKLKKNMTCATTLSKEKNCYIDPGSAFVYNNHLIGIAMFGTLCHSCYSTMTVFTNIYPYLRFIQETLNT